jgi:hypothetical protein
MPDASTVQTICGSLLLGLVLAGVFFLAYHGTITGDAALAVVGTIVGAGVGTLAHQSGAKVGARAASEAKK